MFIFIPHYRQNYQAMKFFTSILICFCLLLVGKVGGQIITTYAGGGAGSYPSDGGLATSAVLADPCGGIFDKHGNYYFVDGLGGHRVRKITPTGLITTIAGTGVQGFSGDSGLATFAKINTPQAVALDTSGNIFFTDHENNRIRKINASTGVITTIAGTGILASTGSGGAATNASLGNPLDICFDKQQNLYVAEHYSGRVRKISPSGIITDFAGNGIAGMGYGGDGGRADTTKIGNPGSVCVDSSGNVFIADLVNALILKVNTTGIISTYAGNSAGYLYNGDEIPATSAYISPVRINFDMLGNLFIAEYFNYRVRKVDFLGIIHTAAGIGTPGFSGDNGPATAAQFNYPSGIAFDKCNNLYIPETGSNRVRKVTFNTSCGAVAVNDVQTVEEGLSIFPNPVASLLHISNVQPGSTYILYEMTGRAIASGVLDKTDNEIYMGRMTQGVYLLQLVGSDGVRQLRKVVKD